METTLGAPTPEELAKLSLEEKLELKRKVDDVKEPWPKEDKDDCDSAEEFASDGWEFLYSINGRLISSHRSHCLQELTKFHPGTNQTPLDPFRPSILLQTLVSSGYRN